MDLDEGDPQSTVEVVESEEGLDLIAKTGALNAREGSKGSLPDAQPTQEGHLLQPRTIMM